MSERNGRPSLLEMARSVVAAPFEERVARAEQAKYEQLQYEAANRVMSEIARRVEPEDDEFSIMLSGKDATRDMDEETLSALRASALRASLRDPHMVGYLRGLKRFVMGKGPVFSAGTDDTALDERCDEWWEQFRELNHWNELEDEIPHRTWRDGEVFIRDFVQEFEGPVGTLSAENYRRFASVVVDLEAELPQVPAGMLMLRFVDPDDVRDPKAKVSHGILTAEDDVQTVIAYLVARKGSTTAEPEVVPASEIQHIKIGVDSDVKRGRSLLEPLLRRNKQYEEWLEYRVLLSLARTAIVLIKKIEGGTPSQVQQIRDAQAKQRSDPRNDRKVRRLKPMTTIQASGGISYEYLTPNLQASDAQHDGRAILLTMAAATGMPEYMFTGDSSNANYASTLVSESPAIREFESWQDFFTAHYRSIYRRVMVAAAEAGAIQGLTPDMAAELPVEIEWPAMIARDELSHTKANEIRRKNKVLSRESWATDDGLDWEQEKERLSADTDDDDERDAQAMARLAMGGSDGPEPKEPEDDDE